MVFGRYSRKYCHQSARIWRQTPIHSPTVRFYKSSSYQSKLIGQEPRFNPLGIEMLPGRLHKQVFGSDNLDGQELWQPSIPNHYNLKKCIQHLKRHDLLPKQLSEIDTIYEYHKYLSLRPDLDQTQHISAGEEIVMDIPKLVGNNIDQHFHKLGQRYSSTYRNMANNLIKNATKIVESMPDKWSDEPGWTRYEPKEGGGYIVEHVDHPLENTLVFDVETCMNDTIQHLPTLAVAVSDKAWYSWTSGRLMRDDDNITPQHKLSTDDLIPFKSSISQEKLIIGHNIGFDRSFLSDQYDIEASNTKFMDTLSLHMCICGLTGLQRAFKVAQKKRIKDNEPMATDDLRNNMWIEKSSLNNLADVYEFHCGQKISKDDREMFVKGNLKDIRDNFQSLMTYCANDVKATFAVFSTLFSSFSERFPHAVTLAGMLEMSTMFLPVNTSNWSKYIENSQSVYDEFEERLSSSLQDLANKACSLEHSQLSKDVWLWELDWSTQEIKPNKTKLASWQKKQASLSHEKSLEELVDDIYNTKDFMRQIPVFLPGFPKWYRDLCLPHTKASVDDEKDWQPGPTLISTQMRITPKLMQLTWEGYPLHFHQKHGWGYLVPNGDLFAMHLKLQEGHPYEKFPIEEFQKLCVNLNQSHILIDDESDQRINLDLEEDNVQARIDALKDNTEMGTLNLMKLLRKISKKKKISPRYKNEYCEDVEIPGAYFIRLPHKSGPSYNVGNPLGRDFVNKMEDGTLSSLDNNLAKLLLEHSSSLSYWKNNHKRIKSQMVVGMRKEENEPSPYGAILPRVIVAGTVTRRAVEPTWLTASNQDTTRIGSELKAMVQAPQGYCFVGADVDSQELWIASLMGDSYSYKIHGGTGLSYMTLRGSKSEKTDMHSKTADLIGITRSDAKVLNYARIYGAGQKFIERFLINTNNLMKPEEAKAKAKAIFKETKGVRKFYSLKTSLHSSMTDSTKDKPISIPIDMTTEVLKSSSDDNNSCDLDTSSVTKKSSTKDLRVFWDGGTESATFNKLEEIACSAEPRTPVLECQISQALEPSQDQAKDFATSRVNWVVQSSAVDFLHLVLVNMKWLFEELKIDGRFSISIHDEVRYLVKEEDKYKAAFALQVSNLLVRAYFAYKLNMKDLPISVAFFSSVDVDKCLRKEVDMDCKSPSNPHGLIESYNIPAGESLDVKDILEKFTYKA